MTNQVQMRWDQRPTESDFTIYGLLWQHLKAQGRNCFTSDDIHKLKKKLDTYIEQHPEDKEAVTFTLTDSRGNNNIGSLIARWKYGQLIIDTKRQVPSEVESNHSRRISVYRMRGLLDRWEMAQQENR